MTTGEITREIVLPAAIVIAGFVSIFALAGFVERQRPALAVGYEDTDLTLKGANLRGYALGMEGLIADYYFMRSLQYVGDKLVNSKAEFIDIEDLRGLNPRLLHPLLDNATDLDPHFLAAYSYGAVVLPAIDPDKAIELTAKGIANNREHWRLYQHLAYIYWRLGKFEKAAETYDRGAEVPGASPFMKLMAAAMRTQGGSRATARAIFTEMRASSDDDQVRITAERRLAELDSLDERDVIDKALANFNSANGRCATSLFEIIPQLRNMPLENGKDLRIDAQGRLVDPTGAPYLLDREKCRSAIDPALSGLPATSK